MTTATPTQTYATALEADAFLELHEDWLDLDDTVKIDALLWGRYYIDANFDCVVDYDAISEEVKYATSLLAYDYFIQGDLFFDNKKNIKSKKVVAGKVKTETDYDYARADKPNSLSKVIAILKTVCNHSNGSLTRV
jgi:hypothetical protein